MEKTDDTSWKIQFELLKIWDSSLIYWCIDYCIDLLVLLDMLWSYLELKTDVPLFLENVAPSLCWLSSEAWDHPSGWFLHFHMNADENTSTIKVQNKHDQGEWTLTCRRWRFYKLFFSLSYSLKTASSMPQFLAGSCLCNHACLSSMLKCCLIPLPVNLHPKVKLKNPLPSQSLM